MTILQNSIKFYNLPNPLPNSLYDWNLLARILNSFRVRVIFRLSVNRQSVSLGVESLETHDQIFFFSELNPCRHSPYITFSLTKGWVCYFKLLLTLASAFILGSESRGTRDHILLSQIRDFLFHRLLRLVGLRWMYSTRLHTGF
jgi:hypothetical protein